MALENRACSSEVKAKMYFQRKKSVETDQQKSSATKAKSFAACGWGMQEGGNAPMDGEARYQRLGGTCQS